MNKNELKKILKPLIKQCIKEVVFEEGVLSSIITEVVSATGFQGVDLFEGTEPLSSAGSPNSAPAVQGALGGIDPNDSGVDISGILAVGSGNWSKLIGGKK